MFWNIDNIKQYLEKVKSADEKFNKLKVLYGKLRQEHIDLLRKVFFSFKNVFNIQLLSYCLMINGDDKECLLY